MEVLVEGPFQARTDVAGHADAASGRQVETSATSSCVYVFLGFKVSI